MAKQETYAQDNNVTRNDFLLGSDAENANQTKNFKVGKIVDLTIAQLGDITQGPPGPAGPAGPAGAAGTFPELTYGEVQAEPDELPVLEFGVNQLFSTGASQPGLLPQTGAIGDEHYVIVGQSAIIKASTDFTATIYTASNLDSYEIAAVAGQILKFIRASSNTWFYQIIAPIGSTLQQILDIGNTYLNNGREVTINGFVIVREVSTGKRALIAPDRLVFNPVTGVNQSYSLYPPVAPAGNTIYYLPNNSGTLALSDHKKYSVGITQVGTEAEFYLNVYGNNTIGNIVWTRTGVGIYEGTLAGAFPSIVVAAFNLNTVNQNRATLNRVDSDKVVIRTYNASGVLSDSIMTNAFLEIRVY